MRMLVAFGAVAMAATTMARQIQPAAKPAEPAKKSEPKADPAVKSPVPAGPRDDAAAEKLGWKLGTQAWTFRDRTTFEAIEMAQKLGLKYIELYPGQALSKETGEAKVGPELTAEQRAALKKKLSECGVKLMNFGVVTPGRDPAQMKALFEFAKDMGIQTITCEPQDEIVWDMVEKACKEYGIKAACHNHPKPSKYWNPDTVLAAIKGKDKLLGACADTGHWSRSGLVPVECLKMCEGRIICLHFKDIKDGEDKPWGTGGGDARGMLRELRRQGFTGVISLEYESGKGTELEENAARCVAFFDSVAREIVAEEAKAKDGKGK